MTIAAELEGKRRKTGTVGERTRWAGAVWAIPNVRTSAALNKGGERFRSESLGEEKKRGKGGGRRCKKERVKSVVGGNRDNGSKEATCTSQNRNWANRPPGRLHENKTTIIRSPKHLRREPEVHVERGRGLGPSKSELGCDKGEIR